MGHEQPQAVSAWWNPKKDLESSFDLFKSSWLNLLLLACPFAIAAEALHWSATTIFLLVRYGQLLTSCRRSRPANTCCTLLIMAHVRMWPHTGFALLLFGLQNLTGLIPLALLLGEVTEDLALRLGETIGGLLNATFGEWPGCLTLVAVVMQGSAVIAGMTQSCPYLRCPLGIFRVPMLALAGLIKVVSLSTLSSQLPPALKM